MSFGYRDPINRLMQEILRVREEIGMPNDRNKANGTAVVIVWKASKVCHLVKRSRAPEIIGITAYSETPARSA